MAEKDQDGHQTTAHTNWQIWAGLEHVLSASVWTADLTSLIVAVSLAGVLFRSIQFMRLPGTSRRLPVYLGVVSENGK